MANVKRALTCVLGAVFALASLSAELTKKDLRKIKKQVKSGTIVAPEMTESSDLPNIVKCLEEKCLKYDTEKQLKSVKCVTLDLSKTQIKNIGDSAFEGCIWLEAIMIPNGVTGIGDSAFCSTQGLKSVVLPSSVTQIGSKAFKDCEKLAHLKLPPNVEKIGDDAFSACTSLTSITIAEGVTEIGSGAFRGCTALASLEIPANVAVIGIEAFRGCTELASITIAEGVTEIGDGAFRGCTALASLEIPASVTVIGSWAFSVCTRLASLEIPASVTVIGKRMITGCTALMEQKVPKVLLAAIDEGAMKDMTKEVLFDYCAKCLEARYTREELAMQYTACVVYLEVMWQGLVKVDSLSQHFADEEKRIERIYGNRLNWFMYDAMIARYKEGDVVLQNPMQAALDVVSNTADIKAYASLKLTKYPGDRLARQCATALYALRVMKYYVEYLHAVYSTCLNKFNNYVKTYPPDAELSMLRSGSYAVSNYTRQGILERYLPMASKTREAFASFALEVRGSAGIVYQDDVNRLVSANGRGVYTNRGVLRMPVLDGISAR